jgi:hypothetical protein
MVETMRRPFSRPCGTRGGAGEYPALKRRAIIALSRWDERGRGARTMLGDDENQMPADGKFYPQISRMPQMGEKICAICVICGSPIPHSAI